MDKKDADRRALIAGIGGAVAGSLFVGNAVAGQLNPPAGSVAPTGRRASSIANMIARTPQGVSEPRIPIESLAGTSDCIYNIVASGSYYLTQNLVGAGNKHGIRISASHVDLDLGGFHLNGLGDGTGVSPLSGIISDAENVTVINGSLNGWTRGIDFEHATKFIIWDVTSIGAAIAAFTLGSRGQAYDADAYNSGGSGFMALGTKTLIEQCGAWTCGTGFAAPVAGNILLGNCATECPSPFSIAQGNTYGPIVSVSGDLGANPQSNHHEANYVF